MGLCQAGYDCQAELHYTCACHHCGLARFPAPRACSHIAFKCTALVPEKQAFRVTGTCGDSLMTALKLALTQGWLCWKEILTDCFTSWENTEKELWSWEFVFISPGKSNKSQKDWTNMSCTSLEWDVFFLSDYLGHPTSLDLFSFCIHCGQSCSWSSLVWLPHNDCRTDNQMQQHGCSSNHEQDVQMGLSFQRKTLVWQTLWSTTALASKTLSAGSIWSLCPKLNTPTFGVSRWVQTMTPTPIHRRSLLPVLPPLWPPPLVYLLLFPPRLSLLFCPPLLPVRQKTVPPPSAPSSQGWVPFVWVSLLLFFQDSRPQAGHSHLSWLWSPLRMIGATLAPPLLFTNLLPS